MTWTVPSPYVSTPVGSATLVSLPRAMDIAREAMEAAGSLYEAAQITPRIDALQGRGIAYRVPDPLGDGEDWLIRHYRRGGAVASLLGDRYLRVGVPRPMRELKASAEARRRGIPTPEVITATVHPGPGFYRGDIITAFVPRSTTLADLLFRPPDGERWAPIRSSFARDMEELWEKDGSREKEAAVKRVRLAAARTTGAVVRLAQDRGLVHPDLNLRNVLLQPSGDGFGAYLLDLDRARVEDRPVQSPTREQMLGRFWRSAAKLEEESGRTLSDEERAAFDEGYMVGTRVSHA